MCDLQLSRLNFDLGALGLCGNPIESRLHPCFGGLHWPIGQVSAGKLSCVLWLELITCSVEYDMLICAV